MPRIITPLLVMALCLACQDKPTAATPRARAAAVDAQRLARLDTLGDGALLVGVLDGREWARVHQRLAPVVSKLPGATTAEFAQVADLPGLINVLYKGLFGVETPLDLSALDAQGVVLLNLFEPASFGPPGASAAQINAAGAAPLRHEIVLPATDAAALAAALTTGLQETCKPVAHGCDFGELQMGIKADGDVVRVAGLLPSTPQTAGALLWPKRQPPSVRTPAYLQLARPGAAAGLLVRPWRLRAMATQDGVNQMVMALQSASPDVRPMLFARGLSIVLGGSRLMHAERPDLHDAVVRLVADDAGIAFEGTHTLSAATAKAFETATSRGGRTLGLKVPVIAQAAERIDLNALLDGVGPRPIFAKLKRLRDFAQGLQECGSGCMLHTLLRVPFSTARGALDLAPAEVRAVVRALPTAMQAVLVRLDPQFKPIAALAGDVSTGFDTGQLRALPGAEVHLIPKGDRAVLLIGVGVDPRTVFDVDAPTTPKTTSTLRIEPAALGKAAQLLGAGPVGPVFDALGPITADSALAANGHAFAWRLHVSTSPGVAASPFAPAAARPFNEPVLGYTPSAGDRCLQEAIDGAATAFYSLASLPPGVQRVVIIAKAFAELEPSVKCAESHTATRAAALGVRRLFVQLLGMSVSAQEVTVLAFIEAQCAATKDAWICKEAARIKALPPPAPPPPAPVSAASVAAESAPPGDPLLIAIKPVEARDKATLQSVIRSKVNQVRYCYEKALMKDPKLAGEAVLTFVITPEGTPTGVVSAGEALPPEVHACIAERAKTWAFMPALTPTKVSYPFVFTAQ